MLRYTSCFPTFLMATAMVWSSAGAEPNSGEQSVDVSKIMALAKAQDKDASKEDSSPFPKFEKVTKDMVSSEGLFTLWYYPKSAKDKDKEKLLCQIPAAFLGEQFMLSTSFSGGGFFTGFPLDERVVKWELLDKQLLLIEPNTRFVVDEKKTVSDVVRRTYLESIRTAVRIVTKSPSGDPVIDLGALLKSNFADIGWMSRGQGGSINSKLSKWTKKKAFELNVEIGVELAVSNMHPPGSYDKKMVHYSFWKLPKSDYKPRVADDRVGYFLTANRDWSKPTEARDLFNRYVDRWHLVKRDSSLDLCEPKQPIIFYIEKTVPVRFRRAVRDGILDWNKAFEKIGFVGAVQVRQQTDDNEWKDLDPEDMRYSFFRWVVSGSSFAMGPHRSNPFTGQIYDADIIFNDSMVRVWEARFHRSTSTAITAMKARDPALRQFFEAYPQFKRTDRQWEQFRFGQDDDADLRQAVRQRLIDRGDQSCDYLEGMRHQMAVARTMLADQPGEVIDRFLYDVIKEVVSHEVGHTLGLRHNFKASTIYDLDEIKRRRKTGQATTGSVMDYNPTLFFVKDTMEGHFVTPTIGPYDYWAIEYGYRPVDGSYTPPKSGEDEEKA
ncbi:MAG: zinc-dependent metalloprotease, partial [Phycisphaerae bacterium]